MTKKNLSIVYYNGVWVLLEGLTVHRLGTKYQICGNFIIGTNKDGTKFAICVSGERFRKYGVFTKFFLVDDNRLAVLEIEPRKNEGKPTTIRYTQPNIFDCLQCPNSCFIDIGLLFFKITYLPRDIPPVNRSEI